MEASSVILHLTQDKRIWVCSGLVGFFFWIWGGKELGFSEVDNFWASNLGKSRTHSHESRTKIFIAIHMIGFLIEAKFYNQLFFSSNNSYTRQYILYRLTICGHHVQ